MYEYGEHCKNAMLFVSILLTVIFVVYAVFKINALRAKRLVIFTDLREGEYFQVYVPRFRRFVEINMSCNDPLYICKGYEKNEYVLSKDYGELEAGEYINIQFTGAALMVPLQHYIERERMMQ